MTAQTIEIDHRQYKIYADKSLANQVEKSWFEPTFWHQEGKVVGQSHGRNTAYFVAHLEMQFVLRRYYRGGMMAKLSKEHFFFTGFNSSRAAKEFYMLVEMNKLGLPVPKPIAALVEKHGFLSCKNAILIERINNAQDGFQGLLTEAWSSDLWFKLGKIIKQFHLAGVYHSDMNIHNILLDETEQFWLIDFDKCEFRTPNSNWQQETIMRLKRSLEKEKSKYPKFNFTLENWQQLLDAYQAI